MGFPLESKELFGLFGCLSTSRNVLGNDLLQILSPERSFGSQWWVGIGLGLIESLSPAHTESKHFLYTELRLTCS